MDTPHQRTRAPGATGGRCVLSHLLLWPPVASADLGSQAPDTSYAHGAFSRKPVLLNTPKLPPCPSAERGQEQAGRRARGCWSTCGHSAPVLSPGGALCVTASVHTRSPPQSWRPGASGSDLSPWAPDRAPSALSAFPQHSPLKLPPFSVGGALRSRNPWLLPPPRSPRGPAHLSPQSLHTPPTPASRDSGPADRDLWTHPR